MWQLSWWCCPAHLVPMAIPTGTTPHPHAVPKANKLRIPQPPRGYRAQCSPPPPFTACLVSTLTHYGTTSKFLTLLGGDWMPLCQGALRGWAHMSTGQWGSSGPQEDGSEAKFPGWWGREEGQDQPWDRTRVQGVDEESDPRNSTREWEVKLGRVESRQGVVELVTAVGNCTPSPWQLREPEWSLPQG